MIDREEFDRQMGDHILSEDEIEDVVEKVTQDDPRDLGIVLSGYIFEESINSIQAMMTLLKNMRNMFEAMANMLADYYVDAGWNDSTVCSPKKNEMCLCIYRWYDEDEEESFTYTVGEWKEPDFESSTYGWELELADGIRFTNEAVPFWRHLPKPPEMYEEDE